MKNKSFSCIFHLVLLNFKHFHPTNGAFLPIKRFKNNKKVSTKMVETWSLYVINKMQIA